MPIKKSELYSSLWKSCDELRGGMDASSHPGAPSYLVHALEEAMRLIADLQARVALLESDGSQALAGVWELDDSTDEERAKMDLLDGGISFVYVIFEDGVDPYWARSRVLEYLNAAAARLPDGVTPRSRARCHRGGLGLPICIKGENLSLAELRSLQDWVMRFAISRADGVSEVASVGGFVKQYSITVDPVRMRALNVTLSEIGDAVAASNMDTGGRTVELSEFEFMVRGRGYLGGIADLEMVPIRADGGVPLLLRDVARVEIVPDERRGITELDGDGEVARASYCNGSVPTRST